MRAHIVMGGVVVNTIELLSLEDYPAEDGQLVIDGATGGIGWLYRDGQLQEPEPTEQEDLPALASVSRFQALAALMQAGLLDEVKAWANAPTTAPLHKLAFDTAAEFSRSSPTLAAGAHAMGWSEQQLDALFEAAAHIQA
ncbi:hypothetical protein ACOTHT_30675 [Achromobacter xylosoxidans]